MIPARLDMKKINILILGLITLMLFTACSLNTKTAPDNTNATDNSGTVKEPENDSATPTPDQAGDGKKITFTLYFPTEDNSAIPTEKREIEVKDGATIKAVVEALMAGPETKGLRKAIPDSTKLLSVNKKDNLAILDFSKEFSIGVNGVAEIVERVSLVNTLTEIPGIERVKILIEGKDLIGPSGMPFGEMKRAALDKDGKPLPGENVEVTLYFGDRNAEKLMPEKRTITLNKGDSLERAIVEELARGPFDGSTSPIPKGTRIISVTTKDGICTVNLSEEFIKNHPGGSSAENITINSIVNSLTEQKSVKKVQFLINGEKRDSYINSVFDEPFTRDENTIGK